MDATPLHVTRPQEWAITAAVIGVTVWVLLIIISAAGMSDAKIGPAGDADASDGWWESAAYLFLGVLNASISAAACVIAVRWRGSRLLLAVKLLIPTVLPLLLLGAVPDEYYTQWTVLATPVALPAYLPVLLMVIAAGFLARQRSSGTGGT